MKVLLISGHGAGAYPGSKIILKTFVLYRKNSILTYIKTAGFINISSCYYVLWFN